jgi:hypothetical protein
MYKQYIAKLHMSLTVDIRIFYLCGAYVELLCLFFSSGYLFSVVKFVI